MKKSQARQFFSERRNDLKQAEYQQRNFRLYNQFFLQLDFTLVKCLHIFLPIEGKREVDTWPIIDRLRREHEHIRLSIPKVNGSELENFYFEGIHQLKKNKWGIMEPEQGVPTPTEKIDMVIVPLLAFDKSGNRVGYGKGFYDQFLGECRIRCQRIGVSLFEPVEHIEDIDENDITLTHCLTPHHLYQFAVL
ncbi:MAG: 5-formyltetrahydrofolate cyclo-ligase [Bacteroidota bacterium]|jgi:5-formyltetrahydrofolate cyclo-ligase|nr:5-formyltetrahydrofolate cyclo-ligase [Cytophagales bacterium]MCE2958682.1 5-formyltetrahydrofolate cyclo-ligase [Flammeovirgaceae bacterium]MCZ8069429.1 5-formyltetrahydrofolate cyclo-ligase [Cytophagales bacterium]